MNVSDIALLERWVGQRDAEAFAELTFRHSAMVYATCRRILGNETEAEDVCQECFLTLARVFRSRKARRASLAGWLHTVAIRRSLDRLKADRRRRRREQQYVSENGTPQEAHWDDIQKHVDEAIASLPERLRHPIVNHFLEGRTHQEIAQSLGIPRTTVTSRIARGIEQVRKSLRRRGITISTATLASLLTVEAAEAVPATLTAALGKLALSGAHGPAVAATISQLTAIGGATIMTKKILAGVGVLVLLLLGALTLQGVRDALQVGHGATVMDETAELPKSGSASPAEMRTAQETVADGEPTESPVAEPPEPAGEVPASKVDGAVPDSEDEPVQPASVSGSVIDDQGYPLEDAEVRLEIAEDVLAHNIMKVVNAHTAADGRYEIAGIDVFGIGVAYASADGHVTETAHGIELSAGTIRDDVNFTLKTGRFFVSGRVVSELRRPIPDAMVKLPRFGYEDGSPDAGSFASTDKWSFAITDDEGFFRIAILREGLCDFIVTKKGYGTGFFEGIRTGTDNAVFVLQSGGAIAGKVTRADSGPVRNTLVEVSGFASPNGVSHLNTAPFTLEPASTHTDSYGDYLVDGLGEDFSYTVTARDSAAENRYDSAFEAADSGVRTWARIVHEFSDRMYGKPGIAQKKGVKVQAGLTTSGVDLVIDASSLATVYGAVTDPTGTTPVCPLLVCMAVLDADSIENAAMGGVTLTAPDGSYNLRVNVTDRQRFRVYYTYCEGDGAEEYEVTVLELGPGAREQLNFTTPGPLVVPVRYMDGDNKPFEGISGTMRLVGSHREWGSPVPSDAEGRVVWPGLEPGRTLRAAGYLGEQLMGVSEPFTGGPGETVPEVVVVCAPYGGVEGVVMHPDGSSIANTQIRGTVLHDDGSQVNFQATTDADGAFVALDVLRDGEYPTLLVEYSGADGSEVAAVQNVRIEPNGVTNLGTIQLEPVFAEKAEAVLDME